jgi:Tol biopolymer transport system component
MSLGVLAALSAAFLVPATVGVEPVAADPPKRTELVSIDPNGNRVAYAAVRGISQDGRYVLFGAVTDGFPMVSAYLRDRETGTTEVIGLSTDNVTQLAGYPAALTPDGRYATYQANAFGVGGLRDRVAGTSEVATLTDSDAPVNGSVGELSDDGRYVLFFSSSATVVSGDTNGKHDVFVRDRTAGTTERVSIGDGEEESDDHSSGATISGDGRYVAFDSEATNLVAGDDNGVSDAFVRDRQAGTTVRIAEDAAVHAMSSDGRFVSLVSFIDLVPEDTNGSPDAYVYDRNTQQTELASADASGNAVMTNGADISDDGQRFLFGTDEPLVPGDTNGMGDFYLRDRTTDTIERVSVNSTGGEIHGREEGGGWALSGDGLTAAFATTAPDVVPGDTNFDEDVFVRGPATAPLASLVRPANGAFYQVDQSVTASFTCAAGSTPVASCVGTTANGAPLDTSTAGTFTYAVTATDTAGNVGATNAEYTVLEPESASGSVGADQSVTTDPGGDGATELAPVETTVTTPNPGTVSVAAGPVTTSTPSGFVLLGLQLQISAPSASAAAPLVLVFDVDSTVVGLVNPELLTFIRNGARVPDCLGESTVPEGLTACVTSREESPLDSEDLRLTIISTSASTWNLVAGEPIPPVMSGGPVSSAEGQSGTHVVDVPVTLSAPSAVAVSATWTTQAQTALAGSDFVAGSGTVAFAPGQVARTVPVVVRGDTAVEPNEALRVVLSAPTNATVGGFATVTVVNDDVAGFRVTTSSLPNGKVGTVYSRALAATGGTVPYKWKKLTKLPKGLKLSKTGVITGTPKAAGTFSVGVSVKDAGKKPLRKTATRTFSLRIL